MAAPPNKVSTAIMHWLSTWPKRPQPNSTARNLVTRAGTIPLPAFFPVTTFGQTYPLDDLIRPYLPRLCSAVMVSYHYARQMKPHQRPRVPMCVDSGGFALLFEGARMVASGGLASLRVPQEVPEGAKPRFETLHPREVLEWQEQHADVAFTLDFPIPPNLDAGEAKRRQKWTITNALWALENRRRADLPLYACLQAWDEPSARRAAKIYAAAPFDGVAIGGLVPRARDEDYVLSLVRAVREEIGDKPLHVFGLGKPDTVRKLIAAGVDSTDSSSYVQLAAEGKLWDGSTPFGEHPSPMERVQVALVNLHRACIFKDILMVL